MPPRGHPWIALAVAVTAISTAAVLVRITPGVSAIATGLWRTLIVGILLSPGLIRAFRTGTTLRRSDLAWTILAGLVLALHFWAWFESRLGPETVASFGGERPSAIRYQYTNFLELKTIPVPIGFPRNFTYAILMAVFRRQKTGEGQEVH